MLSLTLTCSIWAGIVLDMQRRTIPERMSLLSQEHTRGTMGSYEGALLALFYVNSESHRGHTITTEEAVSACERYKTAQRRAEK